MTPRSLRPRRSKNCLREARCALAKQKPLVLMHDPVRGGATLEFIEAEECPDELRELIFLMPDAAEARDVITWHRIKVAPKPRPRPPYDHGPQRFLKPMRCLRRALRRRTFSW